MKDRLRYLLLQARDDHDPMREHEVDCFARALGVDRGQIGTVDLIAGTLEEHMVSTTDVFLLGGSGDYSATSDDPWLHRALDSMRAIHASGTPTFASCWGFQAMARAMGGRVIHDPEHAEIGSHELHTTEAGRTDPVFAGVGASFWSQMGHEDRVIELPPNATLLASTKLVEQQAYRFDDAPIYCTQFHPELDLEALLLRLERYPKYVERFAGVPFEEFVKDQRETPEQESLLRDFVERVVLGS